MSRPSHVEMLRAARELTLAETCFVAGYRADLTDGCHVGLLYGSGKAVLADSSTYEGALAQLRAPLSLVPAVDAIARQLCAARKAVA